MWLVTGATGNIGNVLISQLPERGKRDHTLVLPNESSKAVNDLAQTIARFTPFYYRWSRATPRFTPYSVEGLLSNSNIIHVKAKRVSGYHPRALYQSIADAIHWFLESNQMKFNATRIN